MIELIILFALFGFILSVYAYAVETKLKKDISYKPACDISDRISCSKALTSQYANLFFISNSFAGLLFYGLVAILAFFDAILWLKIVTLLGFVATFLLAYLLYFKVKSFCVLCSSLYTINIILFLLSIRGF